MARGSPARIIRPMAVARTAIQPSRERTGRSCASRRMLSSASGTQLRPATRPKWVTCADMPPAKANENAPRKLARLASRRARRKQNIPSPATAQVAIMLTVHAAVPGKMANSQVSGYAAAAFQPASNGAPLQMYGSYSGRCPARISRPARMRSGRFWVRSSPGRTACPSSAGRPKMSAGSVMSRTTATTSPRRRRDARAPRASAVVTPDASDDSALIVRTLQLEPKECALRLTERDRLVLAGGPAGRDHARPRPPPPREGQDRLPSGQARGPQPLGLYPDRHLTFRVTDFGAQVYFDPGHHVVGLAVEGLRVERVPALLEVGEEDGVVDVSQGVRVAPPDRYLALEH